jgi:hypothetical protein
MREEKAGRPAPDGGNDIIMSTPLWERIRENADAMLSNSCLDIRVR